MLPQNKGLVSPESIAPGMSSMTALSTTSMKLDASREGLERIEAEPYLLVLQ